MENTNQLQSPISELEQIKILLPHREPMIMVDSLIFYTEKRAISTLSISQNNIFVSNEVFSETGLLEHMAQTAALHAGYKQSLTKSEVKEGFIGAIKSSDISQLPKLNDIIQTEIEIVYDIGTMTMVKINTSLNGKHIAAAEMSTILNG